MLFHKVFALLATLGVTVALEHGEYEVVAHLRQRRLGDLEQRFWDVANPDSDAYLQHSSLADLASLHGAAEADIAKAREWFVQLGAKRSSIRVSALRDTVVATFSTAVKERVELMIGASVRPLAVEFMVRRDFRPSELESGSDTSRQTVGATSDYTISNIKGAYGIPTDLVATNKSTLQMVWGPGTFGYSKLQLLMHKESQCPLLDMSKVKFDTDNHGKAGGDNYGEGNLDVKMITSFGLGVETIVSNTNTSASTEEGSGFGEALLDFLTELSSRSTLPHVLSMSLGSLSAASCDMLCAKAADMGHSLQECKEFIQTQRQVCMFLSTPQQSRINTALQILGVRGVSVFGSSGDGGSHFSFGRFSGGPLAQTLNEIACKYQMPVFPTTSPYVISVGGEMWDGTPQHPVTWSGFGGGSGGGFSWQFAMPEHQKAAVATYLAKAAHQQGGLPSDSSFNHTGRAYPDISAVAVDGTSQSCPLMAGIFSMIIDARLNAGLPPLGFVAPRLWELAEQHPGEVFGDIGEGNSKTSCSNGFPSVAGGWDANTGWGRPVWAGMMKHLASDERLESSKSSSIIV